MDEYLSEKEQLELIRHWWSDYGWYLTGGVVLGLLALFGYFRYQDATAESAEAAAALYRELEAAVGDDDVGEAERVLASLQAEHEGSPYADNAALLLAKMTLVSDTDRAVEALRGVLENSRDEETAMIARLRLARVLAWRQRYDDALDLLTFDAPGPFAARMSDIRGDILLASGDQDGARAAYTAALIMPGSDAIDRNYLQMKLSSLLTAEPAGPDASTPVIDLEAVEAASDEASAAVSDAAPDEPPDEASEAAGHEP